MYKVSRALQGRVAAPENQPEPEVIHLTMSSAEKTRLVKPKTKKGERVLKEREPQLVEELKKILLVYGSKPSQVVKDVFTDIHKLQPRQAVKFTRKNDDMLPFEAGGEVKLEHFATKSDCGQFLLANHTKKRPHNLILGRFFNHRLYDLLEVGVDNFRPLSSFGSAAAAVQAEDKPCFVFAGEQFEHDPEFKQAKSMLLDLLRGRVVEGFNLLGIDHVIFVTALNRSLLLRQYAIKLKRSGTKVPRVELTEMGPSLDLVLRRSRPAGAELEKEATKQPKLTKKKEKNVSADLLDGKVGRIYMPQQQIDTMPQHKMKALKRDREPVEGGEDAAKPAGTKKIKNRHFTE